MAALFVLAGAQVHAQSGAPVPAPAAPAREAPATPAPSAGATGGSAVPAGGSKSADRAARPPKGEGQATGDGATRPGLQSIYAGLMTDDEKAAYRQKLKDVNTYAQCKALLEATHKAMEPRAKAQGKVIARTPTEACDRAKSRGRVTG